MRSAGTATPPRPVSRSDPGSGRPSSRLAALTSPVAVARVVLVIGFLTVLSAASPAIHGRVAIVAQILPGAFPAAATTGALAVGTLMVVVSRAVRRGKYRAWLLCTLLSAVTIVLDIVKGLDVEEATAAAGLLVLLCARLGFTARPDPHSSLRVIGVAVIGPLVATFLGWLWLSIDVDGQLAGATWWDRVISAFTGLVGISGPVGFVSAEAKETTSVGLVVLGAAVLLALVLALVRPRNISSVGGLGRCFSAGRRVGPTAPASPPRGRRDRRPRET